MDVEDLVVVWRMCLCVCAYVWVATMTCLEEVRGKGLGAIFWNWLASDQHAVVATRSFSLSRSHLISLCLTGLHDANIHRAHTD